MNFHQQSDTIVLGENHGQGEETQARVKKGHWQPTPAQVLRWLPADATPAQQDSAIQANIKPSPIHWSEEPDTLHLPGQPIGHSFRDINMPKYYRESYFTGKPYFNPDLYGGRPGVSGDPVPYSVSRDNVITIILLACFVLMAVAFSKSRRFMTRQVKMFFRYQREDATAITETSDEFQFQFFLVLLTCLLTGMVYFFYVYFYVADTFIIDQNLVVATFSSIVLGSVVVKALLYWLTGWVFFDHRRTELWLKSYLFLLSLEGVALFPIVMLHAYFGISVVAALVATAFVILLCRLLTFYKTYIIFFSQRRDYLQNFLYFCALEITPMVALWGVLTMASSYLKVNF